MWLVTDAGLMTPASFQPRSPDQVLEAAGIWLPLVDKALKRSRRGTERRIQCAIIRDVFSVEVKVEPSWRTEAVTALAKAIYAERRFEDLPVLGDALEAVGAESDLMAHCREQGRVHTRGCHVLDILLGKS
jgi:hypothetical protein